MIMYYSFINLRCDRLSAIFPIRGYLVRKVRTVVKHFLFRHTAPNRKYQGALLQQLPRKHSVELWSNPSFGINRRVSCQCPGSSELLDFLLYHSLIFIVRADPDPNEVVTILNCKRPIIHSGSYRPKFTNF